MHSILMHSVKEDISCSLPQEMSLVFMSLTAYPITSSWFVVESHRMFWVESCWDCNSFNAIIFHPVLQVAAFSKSVIKLHEKLKI